MGDTLKEKIAKIKNFHPHQKFSSYFLSMFSQNC
jgi:hypothetical protein